MSSVTNLNEYKTQRAPRTLNIGHLAQELRNDLRRPSVARAVQQPTGEERMLEELDALAAEHMVKHLELAHKREAFERQMDAERAELDREIEHAAYFAFMAGVPEEAIYSLNDERLSDALNNAIATVQAQA